MSIEYSNKQSLLVLQSRSIIGNEITKNLSKVTRSAIKDMYRILEFYKGLKSGTFYTIEKGLPNKS